jgi:hypothetical protein
VAAAAPVLLIRLAAGDSRSGTLAVVEAVVYAVGVIACTALFERKLLLEAVGYLRGERQRPAVAAA